MYAQPQETHPPQSAPFFADQASANQPPQSAAPVAGAAPGEPVPLKNNLPKLVMYMRLANVAIAILMVTSAVLSSLGSADLSTLVLGCYVSCFGCLLCCFETHLKQVSILIADNCGFLYNAKGRCVFLILIATLCFSLNVIGKVTGGLTVAVACLNLYVICKFPEYEVETKQADLNGAGPDARVLAGQYGKVEMSLPMLFPAPLTHIFALNPHSPLSCSGRLCQAKPRPSPSGRHGHCELCGGEPRRRKSGVCERVRKQTTAGDRHARTTKARRVPGRSPSAWRGV
mmetsp:Transcript_91686/g.262088  ORF Transcript_91686/g.262088 Transcript_91686/m.262088 type:complete len:286 (-) Transcript_91686:63-920(-)